MADAGLDSSSSDSTYLTVAQVAARLNVSQHTIRGWRKRGQLPPAFKLGRLVRWHVDDINQWVKERQERAQRKIEGMIRLGEYFRRERELKQRRRAAG